MKKTAVELLEEQLKKDFMFGYKYLIMFEKAKEMEKEQIQDAHLEGSESYNRQYYNETFKSE